MLQVPSLAQLPSFRRALAGFHAEGRHLDIDVDALPAYIAGLADRGSVVAPGRVPESVFWGVVDGEYVGRVSVRHALNEQLTAWGGHIGYEVRPAMRGRGYGHALLQAVLPHARALGLRQVLLHCDDTNLASARIIEGAGGVFGGLTVNPEGHAGRQYVIQL